MPYNTYKLRNPIAYNSLAGRSFVNSTIITPIPKELIRSGEIEWKVFPLTSQRYDGIIGVNFLKAFESRIDIKNQCWEIFGNLKIPFIKFSNVPNEIAEAFHLEPIVNTKDEIANKINLQHLNSEERQILKCILIKNKDLFYFEGEELTSTHEIKHELHLKHENPVYAKIYRYPQIHEKEIERQVQEMLNQGIIRVSNSPYNSPLWVVPKKSDNSNTKKWRIVIDYRKLNEITIDDKFPIPNIENILDKLGRAQYFTTLDLAKGFHQILLKDEDQKKTAFSTPFGHYEYIRMPFGLKNAPSTFQRLMNSVLREYINKICVVYMDDILIFSTSITEHIASINIIFKKLRESNLKIQINKCNFFCKETEFLGHVLTSKGIKINPKRIENIKSLNLPTTQKQIKSFLGMTGYCRKFIKDYAKISHPMIKYLKKGSVINKHDPSFNNSFETLKDLITSYPILKYPNFDKMFHINTDASNYAIGAVLMQEGHPISFASRTLNSHEVHYSTTEKELLAVVWAVKYFRPYIYGREFQLKTDHQALKWLHTKYLGKDLNPRVQRWILSLGEYKIKIDYMKGKDNVIADFLSRMNSDEQEINILTDSLSLNEGRNSTNISSVAATIHSQIEDQNENITILDTIVNRFKTQIIFEPDCINEINIVNGNTRLLINSKSNQNIITNMLKDHIKDTNVAIYSQISDHDFYSIQKELIQNFPTTKFVKCMHFAQDIDSENQLIKIISIHHKELMHPGIIALYQHLKTKVYNKNLKITINKVTNNCDVCMQAKYDRNPIKPKFKKTDIPTDKNQIIHMDTYVNQRQSFLIFIDKFTKFATAYPLENKTHIEFTEKIKMYLNHKRATKIIADNEFKHINIKDFLTKENIELHLVKPNSHTGNSDVERLNNTITEKLRILNLENKQPIRNQMLEAIKIYNKQYHSTIKVPPIEAEEGKLNTIILKNLKNSQAKRLAKHNRNREEYKEQRNEGYIKNYKSVRHKNEPKFRKHNLTNIHATNIKRPYKFADNIASTHPNIIRSNIISPSTSAT